MRTAKQITLCEVGPRDGLQSEKVRLTAEQKVELIQGLGMEIIPRTMSYNGHNDTQYAQAVAAGYEKYGIVPEYIIAGGEAVIGYDDGEFALDYIRDNLDQPLTLDQIAGQFYISKHYLCRIFKAATGFSVMEYIIYSRVLKARKLLQDGCSVQEAGELSGFSDNSHFIRTFGHLTGTSPGRYAKEYQSSDQILLNN